jgi:peptide/nickel transport system ATP-binding protein
MTQPVLELDQLSIEIATPSGKVHPVRGVSFSIRRGETVGLVGESGCGKSMTSLGIMNLLPPNARREARRLAFAGEDLLQASSRRINALRGNRIAMIFQEPMTALNPAYTIGDQLVEVHRRHKRSSMGTARDRAVYLLEKVGIASAAQRLGQYPHQLSGGLRQRVMIAMALMCGPELLIADEPTTALDVTIQAQILRLLADLRWELGIALLLVTHDLGVVARVADRVNVMYAGEIVESADVHALFSHPCHPYTRGLLDCIPVPGRTEPGQRLGTIPGSVPTWVERSSGCPFRARCALARGACSTGAPERRTGDSHVYRCVVEATPRTHA